jgi:hypothetical protein
MQEFSKQHFSVHSLPLIGSFRRFGIAANFFEVDVCHFSNVEAFAANSSSFSYIHGVKKRKQVPTDIEISEFNVHADLIPPSELEIFFLSCLHQ